MGKISSYIYLIKIEIMADAVWLIVPLSILALGFLSHGWPSINIHKHYHNEENKKQRSKNAGN